MDETRQNLVDRVEIVSAVMKAVENREQLFRVCADVSGEIDEAITALAQAFDVGRVPARAILELQVRRFTPASVDQIRDELAELQRHIRQLDES